MAVVVMVADDDILLKMPISVSLDCSVCFVSLVL